MTKDMKPFNLNIHVLKYSVFKKKMFVLPYYFIGYVSIKHENYFITVWVIAAQRHY